MVTVPGGAAIRRSSKTPKPILTNAQERKQESVDCQQTKRSKMNNTDKLKMRMKAQKILPPSPLKEVPDSYRLRLQGMKMNMEVSLSSSKR